MSNGAPMRGCAIALQHEPLPGIDGRPAAFGHEFRPVVSEESTVLMPPAMRRRIGMKYDPLYVVRACRHCACLYAEPFWEGDQELNPCL